ncbi:efflux RND transporter periplasmic adaptor subunit [Rhodoblastus sp. 17X3]|uniref:efflux RND transporter periplasmic adaptor subunit n=1 Tax=Rhodoblastus sp. 17X3 TaxID=3047026 RepID=UPI0024B81640|nr:efflux RND transporter periplasmic adaptor subunit [Rhodoblastus sp. 17X3]MDI9850063.1 efflux RND transporter periplasmic adaptor subunit [Rhodoblastus sp. 17X3]
MLPFARFTGAFALVAACALWALAMPTLASWSGPAMAQAQDDAILFYRDAMGGAALSSAPKKDGMGMDFLPVRRSAVLPLLAKLPATPSSSTDEPLFWRDPMGGAEISLKPKKDSMGMDFLPVRATDIAGLLPPIGTKSDASPAPKSVEAAKKRILYYRNPMGLADVSPVPKKDGMGMDYLPVYEGEETDSAIVKLPPGKIQRTGVRSEAVQAKAIGDQIRAPGTIQLDERRVTIVSTRSTAYIEKVADVTTGEAVKKGQVLFRFFSPEIAAAAAQYYANPGYEGARTRLDVLNVPPDFIAEIDRSRKVPLSVEWRAPRDGIVMERQATDGMKADAGQSLFKIADLTAVWALVDVAERDYPRIQPGQAVSVHVRGLPERIFSGRVSLIYPQINRETRTARVRVELQNPDLVLRPDMYVEAEIATGDGGKVLTVPDSAVIDSGTRKIIILDLGEGRFEPREVQVGRRGEGAVEIRSGVAEGDKVVTSANFLIDAESNLKAALKGLSQAEDAK